ncbi:sigma-70 family RNA polymerase sigma factor [Chakrabartyella piscis]|uniref:RNA polymerase sigma factor n=1 Tax=Chakrabartyella piscis TaxID=2918914 RepID=UPI00295869DD|nr:sigma-70 family RNA polymerase sigma factor [Chakrabartyella piscis]
MISKEDSNEAVYRSFLAGNEDAFAVLMERLGNPLTLYIYGYTKDFGEAEDLMIEAFAYLVMKRPHVRDNGLKAYLYKAARHMAIRSLQKKKRTFSVLLDELHDLSDEKTLVDSIVDTKEKYETLHQCMENLSPDYREVVYLVYFEGMSHKEAAQIMGKREKQVADLIYRSKKSLKIKLEQEGITNA